MTFTKPPVPELEFIRMFRNHLELDNKLKLLACSSPTIQEHAGYIGKAWFNLGDAHLAESKLMLANGDKTKRAVFSRSYYAAYNSSKAVRYLTAGAVSLTGDDHAKCADLPSDFPNKEQWALKLSELYQDRLRADYDNWSTTDNSFINAPSIAVETAENFINAARIYINNKKGFQI